MKKLTLKNIAVVAAAFTVWMAFSSQANALSIGDSRELGYLQYGIPSGDADRTTYVNALIDLALGGTTTVTLSGQDNFITRSLNDFGPLEDAVWSYKGTGTSIDLGTGYQYLLAKYDGPNWGTEVWYVGGLTGTIDIPTTGGGYGLSGWALFNGPSVPDGGTTVLMLGVAISGLGLIARRIKK